MAKSIKQAMKKGKGKVSIRGWVYRERGSSKVYFVVLRDSTGIIQCVAKKDDLGEKKFGELEGLQIEASMEIQGAIKKDDRAPTGYEVKIEDFKIVGESHEFPIQKDQSTEFLLDQRHLWLRSRYMTAIMKIRSTVFQAFRDYYLKQGYYEFSAPILQPTQSEGGATLFEVKYYKDKLYLTQSWQLFAETGGIFGLEKIFFIGPCFRAEKSKTSRHLSEFWMAEMEAAWMKLDEMLDSIEGVIKYVVEQVLKKHQEELEILERDPKKLEATVKKKFPRKTYDEILKILKEKDGMKVKWGKDLRTIEEDTVMEHFDTPVIVTHYPTETMAFYKPKDPEKPETALCVDVLAPEGYGEIVGGSERSLDVKDMEERLKADGEDPRQYDWYFDARRYGSVPHSGYGLGVERVIAWICGLDNIKDAIPFPRTMLRYKP